MKIKPYFKITSVVSDHSGGIPRLKFKYRGMEYNLNYEFLTTVTLLCCYSVLLYKNRPLIRRNFYMNDIQHNSNQEIKIAYIVNYWEKVVNDTSYHDDKI